MFLNPLCFAMKTMHFHITQTGLSLMTTLLCIKWVLMYNLEPMNNCSGVGLHSSLNWSLDYHNLHYANPIRRIITPH